MVEDHRELTTLQDDVPVYDLRGLNAPSGFKTRNRLEKMASGALLWVEATDPLSGIDVPHFCTQEGHTLIAQERQETLHRFLIRRK
ncbi:sulfurtransferase TusA family protein [Ochrobactrum oryzae]|nr:sulfurtransferase TusA family protein [Brucella oryzae]